MSDPRTQCREFFASRGIVPHQISRDTFNAVFDSVGFRAGPFRESFGDGRYEPYNPRRQAFGIRNDGVGVYCELNDERKDDD